jgi:putative peptidoglycan lipid II flippase
MSGPGGVDLIGGALAALAVAVLGQTAFLIGTYASYARTDTRSPLRSMIVQAVTCFALESIALAVHGTAVVVTLGLAYGAAIAVGGLHLSVRLRKSLGRGRARLSPTVIRAAVGAAAMVGPAWLVARQVAEGVGGAAGPRVGVLAAAVAGLAVYLLVEAALRTTELSWLGSGFTHLLGRNGRAVAGARHG